MDIHALPATALVAGLADGSLTSAGIVEALVARRQQVDGDINAFVATCADALAEARAADRARASGKDLGPLYGLPITIKDNVDIAGMDSTLGLRSRCNRPVAEDAALVAMLREMGAVILGKTNVPQLLLAQETENAVFGVTNNPWRRDRVPGGSSGGEAAALAAGMSPLGIGTDIGGSIRIPAHFCGVVGFKPTLDRWSNRGSASAILGQEVVRAQIGALARTVGDVELLWQALDPRRQADLDPRVVPLEAGDPGAVDLSGLTIGWWDDDPFLPPVASLQRAVHRSKEVLEAAGARLVPYRPVPSEEIIFLWLAAISADGGRAIDGALSGEDISPQLRPSRLLMKVPNRARKALGLVAQRLGEGRLARLLDVLGEKSVGELWELTGRRTALRQREADAWRRSGLDALICPPHVVPALGHRESGDFALSVGAQFRWTLLNFPAGTVPVTTVSADDVGRYPAGGDRIEKKVAAIDRTSAGLPVGVQVVTRPYQEDKLLAVMRAIQNGVSSDADYPSTPV